MHRRATGPSAGARPMIANAVVVGGHGAQLRDGQAVADDLGAGVEENRGDYALAA